MVLDSPKWSIVVLMVTVMLEDILKLSRGTGLGHSFAHALAVVHPHNIILFSFQFKRNWLGHILMLMLMLLLMLILMLMLMLLPILMLNLFFFQFKRNRVGQNCSSCS